MMMLAPTEIVISQQVWVCDACGCHDNKSCSCNSTAHMEALAASREANRQAARKYREKDEQNQRSRHNDADVDIIEEYEDEVAPKPRDIPETRHDEWYTPAEHIRAAREVLGSIDLDPATHTHAQATVRAGNFYTKDDDGLKYDWHGTVWLNPPYSQPAEFVSKLCAEYQAGRVTSAIMLTNSYTDTEWFHNAATTADAICFTRQRVKFYDIDGRVAAPRLGQTLFYFGSDTDVFHPMLRLDWPCCSPGEAADALKSLMRL